jgi:hypothetical protein
MQISVIALTLALFLLTIYLAYSLLYFTYGLFNDSVSSSDYVVSNGRMISS